MELPFSSFFVVISTNLNIVSFHSKMISESKREEKMAAVLREEVDEGRACYIRTEA